MAIERFEIDTEQWAVVPREVLDRFPEINVSNYDHDDACRLNAWGVELVLAAAPRPEAVPKCLTCNDHGMIGGPSYYQPDEGGAPCQDCTPKTEPRPLLHCAADRDGDCAHAGCPQLRDNEPETTGRHCPLDHQEDEP